MLTAACRGEKIKPEKQNIDMHTRRMRDLTVLMR